VNALNDALWRGSCFVWPKWPRGCGRYPLERGCGRYPLESSCAGLTRASIEKNSFEADGLPGHKRVHARLQRALPGNDEITAAELAARRRTVRGNSHLTMSSSPDLLVPAARFAPGFCIVASLTPNRGVGGAPRNVRVQRHPLGVHITRHARRLARRHASRNAGRSPLGAPPWRFFTRGRASVSFGARRHTTAGIRLPDPCSELLAARS
jgi:hypothetical protein